jgi:hypothetical protein
MLLIARWAILGKFDRANERTNKAQIIFAERQQYYRTPRGNCGVGHYERGTI